MNQTVAQHPVPCKLSLKQIVLAAAGSLEAGLPTPARANEHGSKWATPMPSIGSEGLHQWCWLEERGKQGDRELCQQRGGEGGMNQGRPSDRIPRPWRAIQGFM